MSSTKIFTLIPKIMAEVGSITKDRNNTQQGYKFRGIDDVYNALQAPLAKYGVFYAPNVLEQFREERTGKSGGNLIYTVMRVKFIFYADDGSSFEVTTVGEAMDSGDKSANKAMSAALKYALLQVFCVPTIEDPESRDTEYQHHEVKPRVAAINQVNRPTHVQQRQPAAPVAQDQQPTATTARCEVCGTTLNFSAKSNGYYCPNFKDKSKGNHTYKKASEIAEFITQQSVFEEHPMDWETEPSGNGAA